MSISVRVAVRYLIAEGELSVQEEMAAFDKQVDGLSHKMKGSFGREFTLHGKSFKFFYSPPWSAKKPYVLSVDGTIVTSKATPAEVIADARVRYEKIARKHLGVKTPSKEVPVDPRSEEEKRRDREAEGILREMRRRERDQKWRDRM